MKQIYAIEISLSTVSFFSGHERRIPEGTSCIFTHGRYRFLKHFSTELRLNSEPFAMFEYIPSAVIQSFIRVLGDFHGPEQEFVQVIDRGVGNRVVAYKVDRRAVDVFLRRCKLHAPLGDSMRHR